MVYITIVGKEMRKYNEIVSEDDTYIQITKRIRRTKEVCLENNGVVVMSDEEFDDIISKLKKLQRLGFIVRPHLDTYNASSRIKLQRLLSDCGVPEDLFEYGRNKTTICAITDIRDIATAWDGDDSRPYIKFNNRSTIYAIPSKARELWGSIDPINLSSCDLIAPNEDLYLCNNYFLYDSYGNITTYDREIRLVIGHYEGEVRFTKIGSFSIPDKILNAIKSVIGANSLVISDDYKEFNYIKMDGLKNISYIPKDKLERALSDSNMDRFRCTTSALKFIKKVFCLPDSKLNRISDILDFDDDNFDNIEIVSGSDIAYCYLNGAQDGTIGRSCMRSVSSKKFDIYKDNAKLVVIRKNGITKARALLWEATDSDGNVVNIMDRIYTADHRDVGKFCNYAKKNGWIRLNNQSAGERFGVDKDGKTVDLRKYVVHIKDIEYDSYPWVDTFCCRKGNILFPDGIIVVMRSL